MVGRIDPANGIHYGYLETPNPDGGYTLMVTLPQGDHFAYWDERAAEICGHTNYRKNIFSAQTQYYNTGQGLGLYLLAPVRGYLYCDPSEPAASAVADNADETDAE